MNYAADMGVLAVGRSRRRSVARLTVWDRAVDLWVPLGLLGLALGYAVLHEGGRTLVEWNVTLLALGLVALAYRLVASKTDRSPDLDGWLKALVVLAPAFVLFQMVPLPMFVVRMLSPGKAHLAGLQGAIGPVPAFTALTLNSETTASNFIDIAACTVAFLLVRDLAWRSRRHRYAIALPLVAIGVVEAGIAMAQAAAGADVAGTYRSKNHFAGLLEMVLPLAVACGVALLSGNRFRRATAAAVAGGVALLGASALMFGVLTDSLAKMGFAAALAGLFVMGTLAALTTLKGRTRWATLVGGAILFAGLFAALPSDRLVNAFSGGDEMVSAEGRIPIWRDTLRLAADYPVTGTGLGTYQSAFQKYQTASVDWAYVFAHNDYLQLVAEAGVPGASLFLALMTTVFVRAVRAAAGDAEWDTRVLALGCAGSFAAIALHSIVDFNTHIPANALALAWIAGIAASFPMGRAKKGRRPCSTFSWRWAIALAAVLVLYAPARIALAADGRANESTERRFCRLGICDIRSVVEAETRERGGSVAAVPIELLSEAVHRDPAEPGRWCDLADAMLKGGRADEARRFMSTALELGPRIPTVHQRAATFYFDLGETSQALAHTARVLEVTNAYDDAVFGDYLQRKLPAATVLAGGLPREPRAVQEYLRFLIRNENAGDAAVVWRELLANHYGDDRLAREYFNFVYSQRRYDDAARAWAHYLGHRAGGYLESNWVFNGGFESAPSGTPFDWTIESLNDDVEAALDATVARSGHQSLRLRFGGKENVEYARTVQSVIVTPGVYRFEAFVRADGLTTDQGIGFDIFDSEGSVQKHVRTEHVVGTTGWKHIEQLVPVAAGTRLLTVQVVRSRSLKFDNQIAGTAWIDDVRLERVQ